MPNFEKQKQKTKFQKTNLYEFETIPHPSDKGLVIMDFTNFKLMLQESV